MTPQLSAKLAKMQALHEAATKNWVFRAGHSSAGDPIDLLMSEVLIDGRAASEAEDPEYAEVLYPGGFGDAQVSANWALLPEVRNALPALLACVRALVKRQDFPYHAITCEYNNFVARGGEHGKCDCGYDEAREALAAFAGEEKP